MSGPSPRARRIHQDVQHQLTMLIDLAELEEGLGLRVSRVSSWSVKEQLEHLARVDRSVLDVIDEIERDELTRPGRPKLLGWALLLFRFLPRGRAEAPQGSVPEAWPVEKTQEELRGVAERVAGIGKRLVALEGIRGTRPHPILGGFKPMHWLRFLQVHHAHHLSIIRDIQEAGRPGEDSAAQ